MTNLEIVSRPDLVVISEPNKSRLSQEDSITGRPLSLQSATHRVHNTHGSAVSLEEAIRRPEATSEPSCSARNSIDGFIRDQSMACTSTSNQGKNVADEVPTSTSAQTSSRPSSRQFLSSSPFHTFSHAIPTYDDFMIGLGSNNQKGDVEKCFKCGDCVETDVSGGAMHNDSHATSAPMGALDDVMDKAIQQEETASNPVLRMVAMQQQDRMNRTSKYAHVQQQSAAERLLTSNNNGSTNNNINLKGRAVWPTRGLSSPITGIHASNTTLKQSMFQINGGIPVGPSDMVSAASHLSPDFALDSYGGVHSMMSPRQSGEYSPSPKSPSTLHQRRSTDTTNSSASAASTSARTSISSQHENPNVFTMNTVMTDNNGNSYNEFSRGAGSTATTATMPLSQNPRTSQRTLGATGHPAQTRSSIDLLLGHSLSAIPSRNSIDSFQELLMATAAMAPTSLSNDSVQPVRSSAETHLANARYDLMNLSLDPASELILSEIASSSSKGNASNPLAAAAAARSRSPPVALKTLADKCTSVTVVAEPTAYTAYRAPTAGPSRGAMASTLVDQSYLNAETAAASAYLSSKRMSQFPDQIDTMNKNTGDNETENNKSSPRQIYQAHRRLDGGSKSSPGGASAPGNHSPGCTTGLSNHTASSSTLVTTMLDADLHDTFGAHAWYCGPSAGHSTAPSKFSSGTTTVASNTPIITAATNNKNDNNNKSHLMTNNKGIGCSKTPNSYNNTDSNNGTTDVKYTVRPTDVSTHVSATPSSPNSKILNNTTINSIKNTMKPHARHLELTSVPGQHSVTLHDAQCIVPSYEFLRQRRLAKAKEGLENFSGGYIAEAKRVLNEAMNNASKKELENRDSSYSGALGPLLRHMTTAAGDDAKTRAALHTLSLLESNLPNRSIIAELQGRRILASVLRRSRALDVREQAVSLLWDLDSSAGRDAAPELEKEDIFALTALLEETGDAAVASHALHLLDAAFELPLKPAAEVDSNDAADNISKTKNESNKIYETMQKGREKEERMTATKDDQMEKAFGKRTPPPNPVPHHRVSFSAEELRELAQRIVKEVCSHKHRLQDAAQYTVGALLGSVLSDHTLDVEDVTASIDALVTPLARCTDPAQCQILLTVISSLAGKPRLLGILARGNGRARGAVLRCGQNMEDVRLRARALSLIKVINKEEHSALSHSWYFGPGDNF